MDGRGIFYCATGEIEYCKMQKGMFRGVENKSGVSVRYSADRSIAWKYVDGKRRGKQVETVSLQVAADEISKVCGFHFKGPVAPPKDIDKICHKIEDQGIPPSTLDF